MGYGTFLQRRDAARIVANVRFIMAINSTGSATVIGNVLCFNPTTAAAGKYVIQPTTANLSSFAGIATEAIADAEPVVLQTQGYCAAVKAIGHSDMTAGDILVPTNTQDYASYSSAASGAPAFMICVTPRTVTASAATIQAILYCGLA